MRTIPLGLALLLNPNRRSTGAHYNTTQYFAFSDVQTDDCICALTYRLFHEPVDGLVPRLVHNARHALRLSPIAVESACDVLDEGFWVFARGTRSSVNGTENAEDAMAGQIGCR